MPTRTLHCGTPYISFPKKSFLENLGDKAANGLDKATEGLLFLCTKEIKSIFPLRMLSGVAAVVAGTIALIASTVFHLIALLGMTSGIAIGSESLAKAFRSIYDSSTKITGISMFVTVRSIANIFTLTAFRNKAYFASLAN